jgi:hypothetical protein
MLSLPRHLLILRLELGDRAYYSSDFSASKFDVKGESVSALDVSENNTRSFTATPVAKFPMLHHLLLKNRSNKKIIRSDFSNMKRSSVA